MRERKELKGNCFCINQGLVNVQRCSEQSARGEPHGIARRVTKTIRRQTTCGRNDEIFISPGLHDSTLMIPFFLLSKSVRREDAKQGQKEDETS